MKSHSKKIALIMCVCLILSMFATACGPNSGSGNNGTDSKYVYVSEFKTLDGFDADFNMGGFDGTYFYYVGSKPDPESGGNAFIMTDVRVRNVDTSEEKIIFDGLDNNKYVSRLSIDVNSNCYFIVQETTSQPNTGDFPAVEPRTAAYTSEAAEETETLPEREASDIQETEAVTDDAVTDDAAVADEKPPAEDDVIPEYEPPKEHFMQFDKDGNSLLDIDLKTFKSDENIFFSGMPCLIDPDGRIVLTDSTGNIYALNPDATLDFQLKLEENTWISGLELNGAGKSFVAYQDNIGTLYRKEINFEGKKFGSTTTQIDINNGYVTTLGGADGNTYIDDGLSLIMSDFSVAGSPSEILFDWINVGVNADNSYYRAVAEDGTVKLVTFDFRSNDKTSAPSTGIGKPAPVKPKVELVTLTKTLASEVPEKKVIKYATINGRVSIAYEILDFNKTSQDCRIEVKYYEQEEKDRFDMDIASGVAGDIIELPYNSSIKKYTSGGGFADLYEFMDNDPEFARDNFFESLLNVYSTDGKLTSFCPTFSLQTVIKAKSYNTGSDWTWGGMVDLSKKLSAENKYLLNNTMSQSDALATFIQYSLQDFVDFETGISSLDSPDFIQLLTLAALFPKEYSPNGDYPDMQAQFRSGEIKLYPYSLYSLSDYLYAASLYGEEIEAIGFPSSKENGAVTVLRSGSSYGMSSKSKNKEEAWSFLKQLLSKDSMSANMYSFPIRKDAFEISLAAQKVSLADYAENYYKDDPYFVPDLYTDANYDKYGNLLKASIDSLDSLAMSDETVAKIITDEAAAFFGGQKSAEETAKVIQSRVQVYLNETS